jgi:hypothetical protein
MVMAQVLEAVTPLASVTPILNVPAPVGVPVTAPVAVFNVKPPGSVPLAMLNVKLAVPPVTVGVPLLKAAPTSPVVTAEQLRVGTALIVMGHVGDAVTPAPSVILIVKVPLLWGVPEIDPLVVFRVRPTGAVPENANVKGAVPPAIVIAELVNATPTSPAVVDGQVSTGAAAMVNGQVAAAANP